MTGLVILSHFWFERVILSKLLTVFYLLANNFTKIDPREIVKDTSSRMELAPLQLCLVLYHHNHIISRTSSTQESDGEKLIKVLPNSDYCKYLVIT